MPELPEVEAVRRALQPVMEGARFEQVVTRRPDLRTPFPPRFAARLQRNTVRRLVRRAKYLLVDVSSGDTLVMHLGMSGSFHIATAAASGTPAAFHYDRGGAGRHDHVVFRMSSGAIVTFNDPRRFGFMDLLSAADLAAHPVLSRLGPEPLGDDFSATVLARALKGKRTSLKTALLDQRVIAGLGNIYACEALHRARLSPLRRASTMATTTGTPRAPAVALVAATRKVLEDAVNRSLAWQRQDEAGARADLTYFPYRFRVYDREGARCLRPGCGGVVKRIVQMGRSTFYCGRCQR